MQIHRNAQFSDVREVYRRFEANLERGNVDAARRNARDLQAIIAGDNSLSVVDYARVVMFSVEGALADEQNMLDALA